MVNIKDLTEILAYHNSDMKESDVVKFIHLFSICEFKKGEIIVTDKRICNKCYFLISGFVRCYIHDIDNEETTLWFGEKGDLITSFKTLFDNTKGEDLLEAITNCTLFSIDMDEFKNLVTTNSAFTKLYIKLIEDGYQFWENRFRILSQMDVEKRYNEWQGRAKHLDPHLPLGVLAQYLNINQSTLSRIRTKKK
jgi:CRP-like cAMP-binding protein